MSDRNITLHDNITAYGENLGWKANVERVSLLHDDRFQAMLRLLRAADTRDRKSALAYLASKFADSRRPPAALPPLEDDVLTFARAKALSFHTTPGDTFRRTHSTVPHRFTTFCASREVRRSYRDPPPTRRRHVRQYSGRHRRACGWPTHACVRGYRKAGLAQPAPRFPEKDGPLRVKEVRHHCQ